MTVTWGQARACFSPSPPPFPSPRGEGKAPQKPRSVFPLPLSGRGKTPAYGSVSRSCLFLSHSVSFVPPWLVFVLWFASSLAPSAAPLAHAQAGQLVPTSSGVPDAKVLSLREMHIDVGIARGYARVNVRQVFENHTGRIQEGTYRFALPPSAAVGDFAVWDGLVRIPGVILEKQRAREIYGDLTAQRIDPGLLQQGEEEEGGAPGSGPSGGALFSVTVAPIPAWGTKRLELQFQQEVLFTARQGEFRLVLAPPEGQPLVARQLEVRLRIENAEYVPVAGALPLVAGAGGFGLSETNVRLDRDLVVRLRPAHAPPLRLSAFRNPEGRLPDGVALAPWERPSEIPPEMDGFFLLEALPPGEAKEATPSARPPVTLAILFDTSLSHRWSGLEASYASLVRALQALRAEDRFALIPFDREPAEASVAMATPESIEASLQSLRERVLSAGTDLLAALRAARRAAGSTGRVLLLTDGHGAPPSKALEAARGGLPLFTVVAGEAGEALRTESTSLLQPTATSLEADLFFDRLTAPIEAMRAPRQEEAPFAATGGDAKLHDVYPVLLQPPAPGSLSGWLGRYGVPQERVRFTMATPLLPEAQRSLDGALPERATEARDLPRRWARARVDHLLALIEREGERREWIEEIIALSKRYKFVTPYTAFLAAPRSLLRPRRIQPGDPVLRVECDAGIVSATALFPFGLRLPLVRRPGTATWEGRFLVPDGTKDGRYEARILLRDRSGVRLTERKSFVIDGRPPVVRPEPLLPARAGDVVRVAVRTDADVVLLQARLGQQAPVPLRWDTIAKRSVGFLRVPAKLRGRHEVVFEAVDGARNRGFAARVLEVRP